MKKITMLLSLIAIAAVPNFALARHGADDPAGHVRGEGPGHASIMKADDLLQLARRGRGADDAAGHVRRGRGADDPAGHVRGEGAGHA